MSPTDLISKHTANPINFGRVPGFTRSGAARGLLHDDFIAFQVKIKRGCAVDVKWSGTGCAVTMAAASIVAEAIEGKSVINIFSTMSTALAPLKGFNEACLAVIMEAVDCCFDPDPKQRGLVRSQYEF